MTPAEFKAWFDGFTEAFTGCPTKAQWARIKDRVSEIDGRPVTERIYVDRYVDRYWRTYSGVYPGLQGWQYLAQGHIANMQGASGLTAQNIGASAQSSSFNGLAAMNALGRAEGASVS